MAAATGPTTTTTTTSSSTSSHMEANNHFNYGAHPAASANSGLKRSSGDSLYTNGSSMSFPQQGKIPGSHPPATPYPHMGNHQSSLGYDYLWGRQAQYGSAMGPSPGHGMHQKQPPAGMMQAQSQHHYQGHEQYQLNGGMGSPHQPPGAGPPSMSSAGDQYWNRSNPGTQQMGFNSPNVYRSYQSHVHPGIASPQQQHQHQQQQPPAHQASPQHLHSHHHPQQQQQQQQHHHQQQQSSQHYGMMANGMPYYQPQPQQQQQHPPLPAVSAPEPEQAPMIPPAPQSFTPPRGSPQHHHGMGAGQGATGSPLSVSSMLSQDGGSPQGHGRERSPQPASAGMPAVMQGNMSDAYQEVDTGYNNGMEKVLTTGGQRLPHHKSDAFQPKLPLPHEYSQHAECPAAQDPDMGAPSTRDPAVNASPRSMPSHPSGSPASPPPRLSVVPALAPGPAAVDPSTTVMSTPPRVATPPGSAPASGRRPLVPVRILIRLLDLRTGQ
ncbi:hypothetical protein CRUP_012095 [Coryphaenoides rupestris]|nr:hypothetical protein CRUP_012095 [Coryphaenoides rupestris]